MQLNDSANKSTSTQTETLIIYLGIFAVSVIANIAAFIIQLYLYEIPCPLCLLQRFGLLAMLVGSLLCIKYGSALRYNLMIVATIVFTLVVALRHVMIHIEPGDPGYGSVFLGIHLYTWNVFLSICLIIAMSIASLFDLMIPTKILNIIRLNQKIIWKFCLIIAFGLSVMNSVSTYLECDFGMCPSDPSEYINWPKH